MFRNSTPVHHYLSHHGLPILICTYITIIIVMVSASVSEAYLESATLMIASQTEPRHRWCLVVPSRFPRTFVSSMRGYTRCMRKGGFGRTDGTISMEVASLAARGATAPFGAAPRSLIPNLLFHPYLNRFFPQFPFVCFFSFLLRGLRQQMSESVKYWSLASPSQTFGMGGPSEARLSDPAF